MVLVRKSIDDTNGSVYLIRKVRSSNRILRKYAENDDDRQTKRRKHKTMRLIEEIASKDNLNQAFLQVTRNWISVDAYSESL